MEVLSSWRSGAPGDQRRLEVGGEGGMGRTAGRSVVSSVQSTQGFNGLVSLRFHIARGSRGFRWPRGRGLQEDTDSRLGL